MNIFPDTPKITEVDKERIAKVGYLRSWNCLNAALSAHNPSADELKKLIILEVTSMRPRQPILQKLIVRLQKRERDTIEQNISILVK